MKIRTHRFTLPLEHEFTIARGSMSAQHTLILELEHEGIRGYGEATENSFYGHSLDSVTESIERVRPTLEAYSFGNPQELWQQLAPQLVEDRFAQSAIDLAAHDLFGKLAGKRTHELLGLRWERVPTSSYTIGIDSVERMLEKLKEQPGWGVYKIKLGTDRDVDIVRRLREQTSASLRVDANCGWTVDETIENSRALKALGVEFIEQPLPATAADAEQQRVYQESELPIVADESCCVEDDVARCAGRFHGINVKLCKCGGLTPAVRMLQRARQQGMKTMVGCMVESSVGISAAAQLLPLLDYADLDGATLLADDPARGISVSRGVIQRSDVLGNGVELDETRAQALNLTASTDRL